MQVDARNLCVPLRRGEVALRCRPTGVPRIGLHVRARRGPVHRRAYVDLRTRSVSGAGSWRSGSANPCHRVLGAPPPVRPVFRARRAHVEPYLWRSIKNNLRYCTSCANCAFIVI
jgi:hypothetical protein